MARDKEQASKTPSPAAAVVPAPANPVVASPQLDFSGDAGAGMEGTTRESFAIPFLSILQKLSPECDEESSAYRPDVKSGMFINSVTKEVFDGRTGVTFIPCAYRRVFLRWAPRGAEGAGFKGEIAPEQIAEMRQKGEIVELEGKLFAPLPDGSVNPKRCDRFADTRNHYVIFVNKQTGAYSQALISLTSTQIKKSKQLMSLLAGVKLRDARTGAMYTPPTYATMIHATSVGESNDQGSWSGWVMAQDGLVADAELYAAAKALHASVVAGAVTANYDEAGNGDRPRADSFRDDPSF
jgi:hypothetical protein